jgi:Arc/MetJ-type ribon-helix-helix transcriptional regulator
MSYTIPSDVEPKIDAIIANGRFNSAEEVIRKAVDALAEREAFVAEVNASFEELEAGHGVTLEVYETELKSRRESRERQ